MHEHLSAQGTVLTVDLPGFGGTPKPKGSINIGDMAEVLGDTIDELGATNVVLVGHSMGAQWVTELANKRPELASALVLIGPVVNDRRRNFFVQATRLLRDALRESPKTNWIAITDFWRCGLPWYLRQTRYMLSYPIEQRLAKVRVPVLVLRGARDPIANMQWCQRLTGHAHDGSLAVVPGHAHVVQHTAPVEVAERILAFVARCSTRDATT
ncbi:alpha/beta fold hydrolase [Gulosibacter molinativorax]|uniref:Alpha/beta hydrolase n=1 Tax=Gulosibacter molinativorax TaxID=256821 RepID=A0ABT7CBN3_9MICO|nr:alpha/beta hydrolase [Gulosibacter molinativorax]MDJ1372611.1 alpha/beta hydrolase [Gulosibacter molinativorax]QUY62274.1 Putative hydrolase [Gulosibacter molinativorax]